MIPAAQPRSIGGPESFAGSLPGAFVLGFVFGGLPPLLWEPWLRGGIFSYKYVMFMGFGTAFWMIVCGIIAVLARDKAPKNLLKRSSLASFAAAMPIPCVLFWILGYAERGQWIYDRQNLPFLVPFLTVWALLVINGGAMVLALILRTILLSRKPPVT
jgi:hypothetical protein